MLSISKMRSCRVIETSTSRLLRWSSNRREVEVSITPLGSRGERRRHSSQTQRTGLRERYVEHIRTSSRQPESHQIIIQVDSVSLGSV